MTVSTGIKGILFAATTFIGLMILGWLSLTRDPWSPTYDFKRFLVARQYFKWPSECSTLCLEHGSSAWRSHKPFKTTFHLHKFFIFYQWLWNSKKHEFKKYKQLHILYMYILLGKLGCLVKTNIRNKLKFINNCNVLKKLESQW